ncbi:MAG TPA: hypothetical protein VF258_06615 [Luteolibacter sp.]
MISSSSKAPIGNITGQEFGRKTFDLGKPVAGLLEKVEALFK